jgi:hypothetical protein
MNGVDIVRARIATIAFVAAAVSTRIYSLALPQKPTLPALLVTFVAGPPDSMHLRGPVGVTVDRIQVDVYTDATLAGDPLGTARAIADAIYGSPVNGAMTGLVGWAGSIGSPATTVDVIAPASAPIEMYLAEELRQVVVSQDFYVQYRS